MMPLGFTNSSSQYVGPNENIGGINFGSSGNNGTGLEGNPFAGVTSTGLIPPGASQALSVPMLLIFAALGLGVVYLVIRK